MKRKVISIDENKCDGCGQCVNACHEGAIQLVDGKAKLVSDVYCDGLGACIGECPVGAITIEEREAEAFSEKAVEKRKQALHAHHGHQGHACPGSAMRSLKRIKEKASGGERQSSQLGQWPVQLMLVNPQAPYFQDADLLLVADCVPFAYANFHADFLPGKAIAIGCPKLDDAQFYVDKIAEIIKLNDIKSLKVLIMEVPCCSGLVQIARQAVKASGKNVPIEQTTISLAGEIKK